ncbi:MAG: nucleotidyltransferase family protein [Desulfobacula sp.]|uniref:nucleotidyltransferase family protein n=1 Tax=Desulfobacula sp. TaxID=2593537 RepID=UPI0025B90019|nr:nucleotidyltransferase family protein [Desulfobacula sp.]MCD4722150.1 nucleotidyltransferase family protein [Desulfobacula sp.]
MKAFLLAAGLGTRLLPLTNEIPKCIVPINDKPLLGHWFDLLFKSNEIESILVNTHYLPEKVERFIQTSPYRKKIQTVFENELLGTAGSLLKNREFFNDGPFFFVHADNFSIFDPGDFIQAHHLRPKGCDMTMMTFKTDMPEDCGILELDRKNVVTAFHEKVINPPGNLANGAVYILEQSILPFLKKIGKKKIDFSTEVLPHFIGKIYTFHNDQYHRDIGTMESYLKAQDKR